MKLGRIKSKTWFWIALFAVLAAAGAGAYLLRGGGGTMADIYVDGELYRKVDLSAVAVPYDITVRSKYGYNVVHVENGAISVVESDCPEQICVQQGAITDSRVPIVCLPHHLVIQIESP
jgi:hypothetical protein